MFQKWIREYLSFSAGERKAVLILLALIMALAVLPYIVPVQRTQVDPQALADFQREIALLRPVYRDSTRPRAGPGLHSNYPFRTGRTAPPPPAHLFYFDPNTLPEEGWLRLGIPPRTASTILKYREKGGKFRTPADLGKIYSLYEADVARLLPFVRLASSSPATVTSIRTAPASAPAFTRSPPSELHIELNGTDSTTLELLPGIGPRLAARIVAFRDRLGGFYSVDQVAETYGLPDSTFQKIRPQLSLGPSPLRTLQLNQLPADQLQQHPYIRWNLANAIVRYRQQHGNFTNKEELLQIAAITPDIYKKISPYLTIE